MNKWKLIYGLVALLASVSMAHADPQADYEAGLKLYLADRLPDAMITLDGPANQGHVEAQMLLAYILDKSEENAAAVDWYRKASDSGAPKAHYYLGLMLVAGEGVEKDEKQGADLIQKAAEGGYPRAMSWLSQSYAKGQYGLQKDIEKADMWQERADQAEKAAQSEGK